MIIVAGILIIIGGAVVIGNADPAEAEESGRNVLVRNNSINCCRINPNWIGSIA